MKKVVAYCRVSTDHEDQKNSIENQEMYFKEYVKNHKNEGWELVKIYADEGITGTSLKRREDFNRMYRDAQNGKIDLILTKEVCRFARNTVDTLEKTREFKKLGIEVHFIIDNIKTFDNDAELRLGIMATLAQDDSRRTSERVQFGVIQSMKKGVAFGNYVYGYDFVRDELTGKKTKLIINEEEAKVVKYIFNAYLNEGKGAHTIALELKEKGIPIKRPRKKEKSTDWRGETVLGILSNVKYIGDLKQRITYTTDFLEHTKKKNQGEKEFIYTKNHHEPIIDEELFYSTQKELKRRSDLHKHEKSKYTNRHTFSGKLQCGCCEASYVGGENRKRKDGTIRKTWRCYNAVKYGKEHLQDGRQIGCNGKRVNDEVLKKSFLKAFEQIKVNKEEVKKDIEKYIKKAIKECDEDILRGDRLLEQKEKLNREKNRLLDLCVKEIISENVYKTKNNELEEKIEKINIEIQEQENRKMMRENIYEILENARKVVDDILEIKKFSKKVCRELVEKVIIYDDNKFDFYIKGYREPYFFDYKSNILYSHH